MWAKDTTIGYRLANALMRPIHDRMPVIVPPEKYRLWLDPAEHSLGASGRSLCPTIPGSCRRSR